MSGANARFALTDDERAPIDQRPREPELALSPTVSPTTAPGENAAQRAGRPEAVLPGRPLGPSLPAAVELDAAAICRHFAELTAVLPDLVLAVAEHKRGVALAALTRIETLAAHGRKLLEPRR